jgi:hypothetical protein
MDEFTKKSVEKFDKSTVREAVKFIDKNPALKKIRSIKDGESYSTINSGVNDQAYKDGYDNITWSKDKPKPNFKVKVNGKVVSDPDEEK